MPFGHGCMKILEDGLVNGFLVKRCLLFRGVDCRFKMGWGSVQQSEQNMFCSDINSNDRIGLKGEKT